MTTRRKYRKQRASYELPGGLRKLVRALVPRAPIDLPGEYLMQGRPGSGTACAFATGLDTYVPRASKWPPQVTARTLLLPVKDDSDGFPCEALLYQHNHTALVDRN